MRKQPTLQCDVDAIAAIAAAAHVQDYPAGSLLIVQGADDNNLAFILSGRVDIRVNDRHMAYRRDGQHVGEMSVIDPAARRSASVVAAEDTCVAWVEETAFTAVANQHPGLWRSLAMEIADRLRQRAAFIRPPNDTLQLFIGSSSEALPIATKIKDRFAKDNLEVRLWSENVFGASEATMESLESASMGADFAIILCTADDVIKKRGKSPAVLRDNILFELGLFMGGIGRPRTLIVREKGKPLQLPSDLAGITYLSMSTEEGAIEQSLDEITTAVKKRIRELGAK